MNVWMEHIYIHTQIRILICTHIYSYMCVYIYIYICTYIGMGKDKDYVMCSAFANECIGARPLSISPRQAISLMRALPGSMKYISPLRDYFNYFASS